MNAEAAKLRARRKLVRPLSRAALDEMIGEESRPWATTRKDVEDLIIHNWEWHWKDVENRIQRLFRQAL